MSEDLKSKLDEAIRQIVADEFGGRVMVAYNLTAAAVSMSDYGEGAATYCRWVADGQPWHVSRGLSEAGRKMLNASWAEGEDE